MREIKRVLIRGGWVQMIEIYFNAQSGRLPDGRSTAPEAKEAG